MNFLSRDCMISQYFYSHVINVIHKLPNSRVQMLPDKLSDKKDIVPDSCHFVPDSVRVRPLIFRLGCKTVCLNFGAVGIERNFYC